VVLADEIRRWVEPYDPGDSARARASREALLALIDRLADPTARTQYAPGHVTASGLVLADDGAAVLLVFHARLRRWLQPGGHVEARDATLVDTARREVREETGIAVETAAPVLVGVDVHDIPAARGEPGHRHHDLMFRFVSPRHRPRPGSGALAARWCAVSALVDLGVDEPLRRAVARARDGRP
jgi:8-oxo-dGTP pyrophosphatase MutT (NUDIX family)